MPARRTRLIPRVVPVDDVLQLLLDVQAKEGLLVHDPSALRAVPTKNIVDRIRTCASSFDYYSDSIGKSLWGMGNAAREKEHGAFFYGNVTKSRGSSGFIHYFKHHTTANLVEPFLSLIYMVICSIIRPPDRHDEEIISRENAFIVDRWDQQMAIFFNPLWKIDS